MNEAQVRVIELLAEAYNYGRGSVHAHKTAGLATSLFDQLENHGLLPGATIADRRTLVAAAYSHDIGVAPQAQEEVGALHGRALEYALSDSPGPVSFLALQQQLNGSSSPVALDPLTAESRSTLLYCVLWHTATSVYTVGSEPLVNMEKAMLLAGILRISCALDYRLRYRVRGIRVLRASAWLRILVRTLAPSAEEIALAQERTTLLGKALRLRVFVQEVVQE